MTAALIAAMRPTLEALPVGPVAVAASGGGDSTALLLLMAAWARAGGRSLAAVTVDHSLRRESAAEAAAVARLCEREGIPHAILRWEGWQGRGNLQAAARAARRQLIGGWARARGIGAVALGHTLDDQAETVLMRLARGSGVDGLAGMAPLVAACGVVWLRPLLGVRRAALRAWLQAEGVAWAEDPSNADLRFLRARARTALAELGPLGLTPERMAATAARMAEAGAALEAETARLARACLRPGAAGDLELDPAPFARAPRELGLRLLAGALMWVGGGRYRPRLSGLAPLHAAISEGHLAGGATLHGCVIRARRGRVAIRREPARVALPVPLASRHWDGRWTLVAGELREGVLIGATGAGGLAACPGWRKATRASREALLSTPSLWGPGGEHLAAPLVTGDPRWRFVRTAPAAPAWAQLFGLNPPVRSLC